MKKILFLSMTVLFLSACSEKTEFDTAILEEMKQEQDVKDYHIDPELMTSCVVDTMEEKMPGFSDIDPYRRKAYKNYTKMLTMMKSDDPKKTLDELRTDFGSPKALADAHSNYTESLMNCYSAIMARVNSEEEQASPGEEPQAVAGEEPAAKVEAVVPPVTAPEAAKQ